jgi:uncharacterized protein (TIGR03382 family)
MRACLVALLVLAPATASAHIALIYPPPRTDLLKQPNCGVAGSPRSATPTVLAPGETITVQWNETINHTGHYRISFDPDGEDFTIPLSYDDTTQDTNVLIDEIPDVAGQSAYTRDITLPDITCESCTLQVIQMMTDKPPYGDGNDIYFQCADLALRAGAGPDGGLDGGSGASGGCSTTGDSASGLTLAVAVLLIIAPRRKGCYSASTPRSPA